MAYSVLDGLVTACRLADWPTSLSPLSENATIEGVVRAPSAFSITRTSLPSIRATQEFVVPRSMPITLLMKWLLSADAGSPKHCSRPYRVRITGMYGGEPGRARGRGRNLIGRRDDCIT